MSFDFLNVHDRLVYRIINHYADCRASGWSRKKVFDRILSDLKYMSYQRGVEEKNAIDALASVEKLKQIVDTQDRQDCPPELLEELLKHSTSMYANCNLRKRISKKYFDSFHMPLFCERAYELIEKETKKKFNYLQKREK